MKNDHEIIENYWWGTKVMKAPQQVNGGALIEVQRANPLRNFSFLTSGGQITS